MEQQQLQAAPPPAPSSLDALTAVQTAQTQVNTPGQSQSHMSQDQQPLLPPIQQLANHLAQDQGPGQASPQIMTTMQQQQQHYQHAQHPTQHPTPPLQQHQYELPPPPILNGAPPTQQQQQHQPHQQPQQQPPTPAHYTYSPAQPPIGDTNGFPSQMRYSMPLPPNQMDARQLSGGRHKKEIKRRTKTGCLTCRKRRIKVSDAFVALHTHSLWTRRLTGRIHSVTRDTPAVATARRVSANVLATTPSSSLKANPQAFNLRLVMRRLP